MLFLIDDRGRVFRPSHRLQATFGTRLPPAVFADFLAKNLGWISFGINKVECELRLRPAKVNEVALLAAANKLRYAPTRRYRLTWFSDGWSSEEFATASAAVSRVMLLVGDAHADTRAEDFLSRPRKREHLLPNDPLKLLLDAWSSGARGAEQLTALADELVDGRYILAGPDGSSSELCILAGGRDFNIIGRRWLSRIPRLRIADWPDVAYGRWVDKCYRVVWKGAEPTLDDLDCIIQWPKLGRRRHSYRRLILPCRSSLGSRLMLGAMRIDPHVDLRAQIH
jgi:hypothetical protein